MLTSRRRSAGSTLLELMVTVSIVGILLAIGMPQMGDWIRRSSVSAAAEAVQNGLRRAEAEAIRRNVPVTFLLTNDTPSSSSVPSAVANGKNWAIWVPDSSYAVVAADGSGIGYVAGFTLSEVSADVAVSGPDQVLFTGMGRANSLVSGVLTPITSKQVYRVSRTGADKVYCVFVSSGGGIKLCDPSQALGTPRACLPFLTTTDCPPLGS